MADSFCNAQKAGFLLLPRIIGSKSCLMLMAGQAERTSLLVMAVLDKRVALPIWRRSGPATHGYSRKSIALSLEALVLSA